MAEDVSAALKDALAVDAELLARGKGKTLLASHYNRLVAALKTIGDPMSLIVQGKITGVPVPPPNVGPSDTQVPTKSLLQYSSLASTSSTITVFPGCDPPVGGYASGIKQVRLKRGATLLQTWTVGPGILPILTLKQVGTATGGVYSFSAATQTLTSAGIDSYSGNATPGSAADSLHMAAMQVTGDFIAYGALDSLTAGAAYFKTGIRVQADITDAGSKYVAAVDYASGGNLEFRPITGQGCSQGVAYADTTTGRFGLLTRVGDTYSLYETPTGAQPSLMTTPITVALGTSPWVGQFTCRDGSAGSPITGVKSNFTIQQLPSMIYSETGRTAGSTVTYTAEIEDNAGNITTSSTLSIIYPSVSTGPNHPVCGEYAIGSPHQYAGAGVAAKAGDIHEHVPQFYKGWFQNGKNSAGAIADWRAAQNPGLGQSLSISSYMFAADSVNTNADNYTAEIYNTLHSLSLILCRQGTTQEIAHPFDVNRQRVVNYAPIGVGPTSGGLTGGQILMDWGVAFTKVTGMDGGFVDNCAAHQLYAYSDFEFSTMAGSTYPNLGYGRVQDWTRTGSSTPMNDAACLTIHRNGIITYATRLKVQWSGGKACANGTNVYSDFVGVAPSACPLYQVFHKFVVENGFTGPSDTRSFSDQLAEITFMRALSIDGIVLYEHTNPSGSSDQDSRYTLVGNEIAGAYWTPNNVDGQAANLFVKNRIPEYLGTYSGGAGVGWLAKPKQDATGNPGVQLGNGTYRRIYDNGFVDLVPYELSAGATNTAPFNCKDVTSGTTYTIGQSLGFKPRRTGTLYLRT